ncbi:hypothetical protein EYZ11_008472 [Aspergillus tanneri]|uniref:GrpB domain protein n=1 Tax=Aspergillus tanneri TaxID=1220188 RepID=A0A4V3UNQ0_9EURO|nr:hypothetical protein EYZ11_008472 [Aspergillus tanneri]
MPPSIEAIIKHADFDPSKIERISDRREPNKIEIVEPDPSWPQRYQLLKSRIETALGSRVVAITHIGSTSVPGLPAKDVVDIDLTVIDPTDETSYVPLLEDDRELYAQTKRQAAEETIKAGERHAKYNLRKQPVIREILERAFRDIGYIQ